MTIKVWRELSRLRHARIRFFFFARRQLLPKELPQNLPNIAPGQQLLGKHRQDFHFIMAPANGVWKKIEMVLSSFLLLHYQCRAMRDKSDHSPSTHSVWRDCGPMYKSALYCAQNITQYQFAWFIHRVFFSNSGKFISQSLQRLPLYQDKGDNRMPHV